MRLLAEVKVSPELEYHLGKNLSLSENVFRAGSTKFFELFNEVRRLHREQVVELSEEDLFFIDQTEIGQIAEYNHKRVYLDFPIPTYETYTSLKEAKYKGKNVQLNKPKRGGSKKFYVYTKNPKTGNTVRVEFGAEGGGQNLAVKLKDPKARKAFADRHNCEKKTDKTKPGYWSCRLPRYSKALGLQGTGQWW